MLETLERQAKVVKTHEKQWFTADIRPYRTSENVIDVIERVRRLPGGARLSQDRPAGDAAQRPQAVTSRPTTGRAR
jgi:hypothetical protein